MRKLIVGSIVCVVVLVAWVFYLEYDTKHFIESLPDPPEPETQRGGDTPARVTTTPLNTERDDTPGETLEHRVSENTTSITPAIRDEPLTDLEFEDMSIDAFPAPEDTSLPPEVEKLFSAFHPIQQELEAVVKVLNPLLDRHHLASNRISDILHHELPASVDGPERRALEAEFSDIRAWQQSVKEETIRLQDKSRELSAARAALLTEYGIADWQEFFDIHTDAYDAWKSTQ